MAGGAGGLPKLPRPGRTRRLKKTPPAHRRRAGRGQRCLAVATAAAGALPQAHRHQEKAIGGTPGRAAGRAGAAVGAAGTAAAGAAGSGAVGAAAAGAAGAAAGTPMGTVTAHNLISSISNAGPARMDILCRGRLFCDRMGDFQRPGEGGGILEKGLAFFLVYAIINSK